MEKITTVKKKKEKKKTALVANCNVSYDSEALKVTRLAITFLSCAGHHMCVCINIKSASFQWVKHSKEAGIREKDLIILLLWWREEESCTDVCEGFHPPRCQPSLWSKRHVSTTPRSCLTPEITLLFQKNRLNGSVSGEGTLWWVLRQNDFLLMCKCCPTYKTVRFLVRRQQVSDRDGEAEWSLNWTNPRSLHTFWLWATAGSKIWPRSLQISMRKV